MTEIRKVELRRRFVLFSVQLDRTLRELLSARVHAASIFLQIRVFDKLNFDKSEKPERRYVVLKYDNVVKNERLQLSPKNMALSVPRSSVFHKIGHAVV